MILFFSIYDILVSPMLFNADLMLASRLSRSYPFFVSD